MLQDGKTFSQSIGAQPNCVDLFAGAGGFSLAARQAGFVVKLAIENNRHAAATYRRNLCSGVNAPDLIEADIRTLAPAQLKRAHYSNGQRCDLLLGGPPCQGFSAHRLKDSGVGDSRNDLIHIYFNFVRKFKPTLFLMENVPGMLWPRHTQSLDRFYAEASEAGYSVKRALLDARDYGVPQRRKRVFLLGYDMDSDVGDLPWPPAPSHSREALESASSDRQPWIDCSAAFAPAPEEDPNNLHMRHSPCLVETFSRTPPNGGSRKESGRLLRCHQNHDGHNDVYGRINPAQPAPTMTTACINPSKGRFVHPTGNHGITVRQAARIQTFPDWFVFEGGLMAAGEQVGNAVPVELGRSLIAYLRHFLKQGQNSGGSLPDEDRS